MRHRRLLFKNLNKMKVLAKSFAVFLLFVLIFFMILGDKFESKTLASANGIALKVVSPVVHILGVPVRCAKDFYTWVTNVYNVYNENNRLRDENRKLAEKNIKYQALYAEYQLLSHLMHYTPPVEADFVTAKIISNDSLSFSHSVIVYLDKSHNVKIGQVAMNDKGVVGRVEQIGGNYARIMLLNDINSRIPIVTEKDRIRGILAGDNTPTMNLIFTPLDAELKVGDKIVTSGVAGGFPSDLPVGVVVSVQNGRIKVKSFADFNRLEYLRIVDYGIPYEPME